MKMNFWSFLKNEDNATFHKSHIRNCYSQKLFPCIYLTILTRRHDRFPCCFYIMTNNPNITGGIPWLVIVNTVHSF